MEMINYKDLEFNCYKCQVGMYFSNIKQLNNGFIVYSDIVLDQSWNFWTGFNANTTEEFENAFCEVKKFFSLINRAPCFVIGQNTTISPNVEKYINSKYELFSDAVILATNTFIPCKQAGNNATFKRINNETESNLFVEVFKTSKTQTKVGDTYNKLPSYYFDALYQSFQNKTDWEFVHYISMIDDEPAGMVSCCIKDEWCGLYGGGTYLKHRGKGLFVTMLKHIEKEWKTKGVKYFFGITEKDSYNERLYNSINFNTMFDNKYYKEK